MGFVSCVARKFWQDDGKSIFGKKMWITLILMDLGNCWAVAFFVCLRVFKAGVGFKGVGINIV